MDKNGIRLHAYSRTECVGGLRSWPHFRPPLDPDTRNTTFRWGM